MKMHLSYMILVGLLSGGVAFAHPKQSQTQSSSQDQAQAELSEHIFCIRVSGDLSSVENLPQIECPPGVS